jgi:hypothetical protein
MNCHSSIHEKLLYLYLLTAFVSILFSSCSPKSLIGTPQQIKRYEISISEQGIEPVDYENLSEQEWWESYYQYIVNIEANDFGHYFKFERERQLELLVEFIETRGDQFHSDKFGIVKYLAFGNNSGPITNSTYFRILSTQSLSASKRLELLIEKGVEVTREDIDEKMRTSDNLNEKSQNRSTPWILYRFLISKVIDDQRGLFNRALLLSCDKYNCLTGIDGTRRVALAKGKRRYGDLITPESEEYEIVERIFKNIVEEYNAHYKFLK